MVVFSDKVILKNIYRVQVEILHLENCLCSTHTRTSIVPGKSIAVLDTILESGKLNLQDEYTKWKALLTEVMNVVGCTESEVADWEYGE